MQLLSGFLLMSCICVSVVISVSHVPVLLWSTESSVWASAPAVSDGHITSSHELYRLLQQGDVPRTGSIVLFLQDTLSIDDFTYYSTVYGSDNPLHNVQDILDSFPASLVVPAVEKKTIDNLPGYLKKQANWNIINIDNLNVSFLELDDTEPNLIIIRLKSIPRSSQISAATAFAENDKHIGRITQELKDRRVKFTAIYTGMKPSKVAKSFDMVHKQGRDLLATDTAVLYPPLNVSANGSDTCILIYATQFLLTVNSTQLDLTNLTFEAKQANTSLSECSATNTTLSLLYSSPGLGLRSLEVRFFMTNMFYTGSARNWFKLESVMIIPNQNILRNASFRTTYASAPAEYSFHCQQVGTSSLTGEVLVPDNVDSKQWGIFISEFQIQGFNIKNNLFSYAGDCTSFFTPGIWMGLVSSIILLWILSYGIFMIMQLSTNDKFDDSKSQALSVPQGE
ncbi:V-type proton ATPase subunit S1-like isoform X2 [Mixophyes fleayi]|uniref:V-type proton ATPase subunit S1-like isoform X2 n=1 Tax=Mixophyes fleayi TaxID=3061075 RepID=UPI003F4DBF92